MTLSTAQPQLNATPPDLLALDITVVGRGTMAGEPAAGQPGQRRNGQAGHRRQRAWAAWAEAWAAWRRPSSSATSRATCARRPRRS